MHASSAKLPKSAQSWGASVDASTSAALLASAAGAGRAGEQCRQKMLRRPAEEPDQERQTLLSDEAPRTKSVVLQLSLGHAGLTLSDDVELQAVTVVHVHPSDLAARAGLPRSSFQPS